MKAYNLSPYFPRNSPGLTNFLHFHNPANRGFGARLATESGASARPKQPLPQRLLP
jgi:hypothetical protein